MYLEHLTIIANTSFPQEGFYLDLFGGYLFLFYSSLLRILFSFSRQIEYTKWQFKTDHDLVSCQILLS
jgi:hypothetical protein